MAALFLFAFAVVFRLWIVAHKQGVDARSVHLDNAKLEGFPFKSLASYGNTLQNIENKPANRVVIGGVEIFFVEKCKEIVELALTAHRPRIMVSIFYNVERLVFIRYLPNQTFHDVAQNNNALHASKFVNNQSAVELVAFKFLESFVNRHVFGKI